MSVLARIKAAIKEGRYETSEHADEEAEKDDFLPEDVEHALLHGQLVRRFTRDPRGTRYEIVGPATDGRQLAVICRIKTTGKLLLITTYLVE